MNKLQLEKRLKTGGKKSSEIFNRVGNEEDVSKLRISGLRFRGASKVLEKYWNARPSSVYMTCLDISLDQLGTYNGKQERCGICTKKH